MLDRWSLADLGVVHDERAHEARRIGASFGAGASNALEGDFGIHPLWTDEDFLNGDGVP